MAAIGPREDAILAPWSLPHQNPPVLIAGDFLSESTRIRFVCEELASALSARGWTVVTTSKIRSRGLRLADMLATVWMRRTRYQAALLDVYSGSAFLLAEAVGGSLAALRCPFALALRSGAFPDFAARYPSRVRRLLSAATVVTSPSGFLQEQLKAFRPDIRVIPNGLNLADYPARRLSAARPRLVWVRAYERRYNPSLALEVVGRLSEEFPDIELVMAGPDKGDWSAAQTAEQARHLGIGHRVRVMGPVKKTEVWRILHQGDIFLNTTNVDNAPKTVVEAMACGLCVVSTDAGGVSALVSDECNALLVPRGDVASMVHAIKRVVLDSELARRLSHNARQTAEAWDWGKIVPRWEELFCSMATRTTLSR